MKSLALYEKECYNSMHVDTDIVSLLDSGGILYMSTLTIVLLVVFVVFLLVVVFLTVVLFISIPSYYLRIPITRISTKMTSMPLKFSTLYLMVLRTELIISSTGIPKQMIKSI